MPEPRSDDNSAPPDYALAKFYELCIEVFKKVYGFELDYVKHLAEDLQSQGFVNIETKIFHVPVGEWPRDPHLRTIGGYLREIIMDFALAMAARPFVEFGMEKSEVDELINTLWESLGDRNIHAYMPVHYVWAQKPLDSSSA